MQHPSLSSSSGLVPPPLPPAQHQQQQTGSSHQSSTITTSTELPSPPQQQNETIGARTSPLQPQLRTAAIPVQKSVSDIFEFNKLFASDSATYMERMTPEQKTGLETKILDLLGTDRKTFIEDQQSQGISEIKIIIPEKFHELVNTAFFKAQENVDELDSELKTFQSVYGDKYPPEGAWKGMKLLELFQTAGLISTHSTIDNIHEISPLESQQAMDKSEAAQDLETAKRAAESEPRTSEAPEGAA